jgi:hypothetical protein
MESKNIVIGGGRPAKRIHVNGETVGSITGFGGEYFFELTDPRDKKSKRIVSYGSHAYQPTCDLARNLLRQHAVEELIDLYSQEAVDAAMAAMVRGREAAAAAAPSLQAAVDKAYAGAREFGTEPKVSLVDGHQRALLLAGQGTGWIVGITLDSITHEVRIGLNATPANLTVEAAEELAFALDKAAEIKRSVEKTS